MAAILVKIYTQILEANLSYLTENFTNIAQFLTTIFTDNFENIWHLEKHQDHNPGKSASIKRIRKAKFRLNKFCLH